MKIQSVLYENIKINCVRELTYNSAITNTRGYLNLEKELNGNTDRYSPAELMNVFTATHARIGFHHSDMVSKIL